jgi:hypothetical protein
MFSTVQKVWVTFSGTHLLCFIFDFFCSQIIFRELKKMGRKEGRKEGEGGREGRKGEKKGGMEARKRRN